jgi:NADPH:quinone reductase-like Zn-dependent oxidoreductase
VDSGIIFDTDFPVPKPAANEYLIKVQTAAFSHDGLRLARILHPSKFIPQIPLHNFCGVVISTPTAHHDRPDGPKFKVGDAVFGLISNTRDGAAADYTITTEDEMALKPNNISAAEAVTIPGPALTAWQALFTYGRLDPTDPRRMLRVLVTNALENEVATQALQLLRAPSLFPHHRPWVCATCSCLEHDSFLRDKVQVDEVIDAALPLPQDFDLAKIFRKNKWDPVDVVLDCAGEQMFKLAHSSDVVKNNGTVLTAVDATATQGKTADAEAQTQKQGLFSRFVVLKPDGKALDKIKELVEEGYIQGRVQNMVDLVHGANVLASEAAGAGGGRRGGMMVFRVNI